MNASRRTRLAVPSWLRTLGARLRRGRGARPRQRRAVTPTVLQMEAVECGAAALAMILGYHGRFVPLEELRVACGVSRDGSKATNILRAARRYGLEASGYKKLEPDALAGLPLPSIIHWNFNHFVVLEGMRGDRVYLNNPGMGPVVVTAAEFDQAFTGVALVFTPGETFTPGGERPAFFTPLARRLKGLAPAVIFAILAGAALIVPGLVVPAFTRTFVDDVVVKGLDSWVRPLLLVMAVTAMLLFGLTALQRRYLLRLEHRLALTMASQFLWHVLRLPLDFFNQRFAGEIGNRVGLNDRLARLLSGELATTTLQLMLVAMYAMLMIQYDTVLALLCVLTAGLNIIALRFASRRRTILSQRLIQDRGKLMGTAMGGLQTIETLKAGGSESDFFARWAGHQAKVLNGTQDLQLTTLVLSAVPPLLLSINATLVIGVGGLRVMDGRMTIGMLVAFQALVLAFLTPINRLVTLGGQLQEIRGSMSRLDDVLRARRDENVDAASMIDSAREAPAPRKLDGALELREVTFGYSRLEPPLIEGFTLSLKPGGRIALVGGSGSGKSTIAKLVAGLYEPWSGEVLFDGRPRREIPRDVMTGTVAVVDQDVLMFEGTIRDNIVLWDGTVPEHQVVEAARDAAMHDDITARPGVYNGAIEEGGRNFSGGQRQRLEIARALAQNPRLLVLDEATSALDPTTEKIIDDNLRRRGCGCLIVAHRLSTIRDCDEILVLEKGKIVQRGTHQHLIEEDGPYARLIAAE